jgi:tellurite resistance protein
VRISFFPSASIGLILLGTAALPVDATLARWLWTSGAVAHLGLTRAVMTSWLDHGHYEVPHSNPAWFIPVVGNILVPIAGMRFAPIDVSWFFFAIGLVFWLVLLTIIVNRLIFHAPLPGKLVPTLFILLAPPSAGFLSWVTMTGGIDAFAHILYGVAVFMALLLVVQIPRFSRQTFALSWWAYSFPLAAFTIATLVMAEKTGTPAYAWAGLGLAGLLTLLMTGLVGRTVVAIARGEICTPEH